jgi:CxxC-x17-CxxC domain-containing protein
MTDKNDKIDGRDGAEESKKTYTITCTLCGSKDQVPFRPRPDHDVFCGDCYKFKRTGVQKRRESKAPRVKHGTRVMFPIQCAQCGERETLDYVPKGVSLNDVLCSNCVRTTYGDESRWAEISEKKVAEKQAEWSFDCAECGRADYLKFAPKPDEDYLCVRCYNEHESPSPQRLQGKKRVGRAVYIRKSDDDS